MPTNVSKTPPPAGWTCPACGRLFRRANQGHTCDPVPTLDERLTDFTPVQRAVAEAVLDVLPQVGDVYVEPVRVGLFLKRGATFASLRTRRAGLRLLFILPRFLDHARLSCGDRQRLLSSCSATAPRSARSYTRIPHATTLTSPAEVDADVIAWLAESYASSGE